MSEKKKRRRGRAGRSIKKWIKRLLLLAIAAAAALFGLKAYIRSQAANAVEEETYAQVQVMRGAMKDTVYGTGTTSARNQPNLLAEADGTLTDLRVSVGDEVKAGDILAVLTNDTIDDTITDLEFALWDLDETITGTRAGTKVTKVEAPAAGRVMAIYAKPGDDSLAVFRREGSLAVISTDERMRIELTAKEGQLGLSLDEKVMVVGERVYAEGKVVELTRQGTQAAVTVMEEYMPVNDDFDGDGKVDSILGNIVEVRNMDGDLIGEGEIQANKPMYVSAFGGTITHVDVVVGKEIARGERMFRLADSPLTLTVENLRLQRETAFRDLEDAIAQRENLIIVAPCDGAVASLEVAEGDEITTGTLIGSILEGEDMNLTIAVDELDVVSVEIGQPVSITVDALSSLKLTGEVYKIAPVGTNSGGVTTYSVELTFEAAGTGVRSGMNATGEIEIASVEDTLYVPVEALMTMNNRTYVMVADGGSTALADAMKSAGEESRRGPRIQGAQGNFPNPEGRPDMNSVPAMGAMPDAADEPDMAKKPDAAQQEEAAPAGFWMDTAVTFVKHTAGDAVTLVKGFAGDMLEKLNAWLYEGIETTSAPQVTGSLIEVEIGLQNDDYAEILSGLSEGDAILYTADETESSSRYGNMMGGMFGGGNMRNMGGGMR